MQTVADATKAPTTNWFDKPLVIFTILLVSISFTIFAWVYSNGTIKARTEDKFHASAQAIARDVQEVVIDYERGLMGGAGLYQASQRVQRDQWHDYVSQMNISKYYPGMLAMGVAAAVKPEARKKFEAMVRADGYPDYHISSFLEQQINFPVLYIEPFNQMNQRAFGFNLYSHPVRRAAINRAIDSGKSAMTRMVILKQNDDAHQLERGFLYFFPIYKKHVPLDTVEQRRKAIEFLVYSAFRSFDLLDGILKPEYKGLNIELFDDDQEAPSEIVYSTLAERSVNSEAAEFREDLVLTLGDRHWKLRVTSTPSYIAAIDTRQSTIVLMAGLFLNALLIAMFVGAAKRRKLEKQSEENRLRAIIDNVVDGIITIDEHGVIESVNHAAVEIFGYTPEEMIGKNVSMLMPEPHRSRHDNYIKQYRDTGRRKIVGMRRDLQGVRKDGSPFYVELSVSEILIHERLAFTGIVRDISEQRSAEEKLKQFASDLEFQSWALEEAKEKAETAAKVKANFLANMSHEIRTPMNAIMGLAQLCMKTSLDDKQRSYLNRILDASTLLLEIINDVLDFSKIEAGKMTVEHIPIDIAKIIDDVCFMMLPRATDKHSRIDIDNQLNSNHFLGDPVRLHQVLLNLVSNAIKFTSEGSISIEVRQLACDNKVASLQFTVTDTGIGMTSEQAGRLFQSFEQVDASTTRKYGGTGLGLAISKQLVELMDGYIGVTSTPGVGSKFRFTIRLGLDQSQQALASIGEKLLQPDQHAAVDHSQHRILLVDDVEVNRDIAYEFLSLEGYQIVTAASGAEAIARAKTERFDVILMDIQMPEMDGYQTTSILRSLPDIAMTPIIAMTANAMKEDKERCLASGLDDHIGKPINPDELFQTLDHWLNPPAAPVVTHAKN